MKTRYRQLRQYIATANKMQSNGFGLKIPVPLVPDDGRIDQIDDALIQVDNLTKLTEENEYKQFIFMHLNSIKYELERQLSNLNHDSQSR